MENAAVSFISQAISTDILWHKPGLKQQIFETVEEETLREEGLRRARWILETPEKMHFYGESDY